MKRLKEAIDKYLVQIICALLVGIGGFVWDYVTRFVDAPNKIERLETIRKIDSLTLVKIKEGMIKEINDHSDSLTAHRKMLNQHEADILWFYKK